MPRPAPCASRHGEINVCDGDYLAAAEMMSIRGRRLLAGHILPCACHLPLSRLALNLGIILAAAGLQVSWAWYFARQ